MTEEYIHWKKRIIEITYPEEVVSFEYVLKQLRHMLPKTASVKIVPAIKTTEQEKC